MLRSFKVCACHVGCRLLSLKCHDLAICWKSLCHGKRGVPSKGTHIQGPLDLAKLRKQLQQLRLCLPRNHLCLHRHLSCARLCKTCPLVIGCSCLCCDRLQSSRWLCAVLS